MGSNLCIASFEMDLPALQRSACACSYTLLRGKPEIGELADLFSYVIFLEPLLH
jgi:hypothetical protein